MEILQDHDEQTNDLKEDIGARLSIIILIHSFLKSSGGSHQSSFVRWGHRLIISRLLQQMHRVSHQSSARLQLA